jgi:hypothetical protein
MENKKPGNKPRSEWLSNAKNLYKMTANYPE